MNMNVDPCPNHDVGLANFCNLVEEASGEKRVPEPIITVCTEHWQI